MDTWEIVENKLLKEKLWRRSVYPGLELFILPKHDYRKKYAVISTHFGSIDNSYRIEGSPEVQQQPDGVAHFLEHKLFEDEQGNVFDRFAALGASANAYTSFTNTSYLFSCTELFEENLKLLLDFVQEPYFTLESVQKEQGIIGQEIKMYQDHPGWRLFFNLLEALYVAHPVRNDIAGTLESIARIDPELLYRCYQTYYHPSNMSLFVVGDLNPDRVWQIVEENIARRGYQPMGEIERFYPEEPLRINEQRAIQEMVVSEPMINIGFKDHAAGGLRGEQLFRREIAVELLLDIIFGQSEPLFNKLYQEGLVNVQFDAAYTAEQSYAYTLIGGETRDPEQLYRRILEAIDEFRQKGLAKEKFERHRRSQLGGFIRQFNSPEFIANNFLNYYLKGIDFFSFPVVLQQVTLEEVNALLTDLLAPERHALSVILPRKT